MAATRLLPASWRRVFQPDGISVYRPIIASALHQGALLFVPALLSAASFFSNLLYFPSPKDKKITCVLQAPYTAPLFSLWLCVSIAVASSRQYNENSYQSITHTPSHSAHRSRREGWRVERSERMAVTKLVLVRHGESQWNNENRFTGWYDVDLSEKGVSEAKAAGKLLKASALILLIPPC
jgi:hypothetical protein